MIVSGNVRRKHMDRQTIIYPFLVYIYTHSWAVRQYVLNECTSLFITKNDFVLACSFYATREESNGISGAYPARRVSQHAPPSGGSP